MEILPLIVYNGNRYDVSGNPVCEQTAAGAVHPLTRQNAA